MKQVHLSQATYTLWSAPAQTVHGPQQVIKPLGFNFLLLISVTSCAKTKIGTEQQFPPPSYNTKILAVAHRVPPALPLLALTPLSFTPDTVLLLKHSKLTWVFS